MQNDHQNTSRGTVPRSCIQDDRSPTPRFQLADPFGRDDAGESETKWRTATRLAVNNAAAIDFSLSTTMDAASRHLLSRYSAGETRIVAVCEQAGQLAESIGGTPGPSVPAVCEPFGIWVSLGRVKCDKDNKFT
jgi:hypothetical protein